MIESLVVISLAVTTISITVSKSKIFQSTREWITSKSKWIGELVSCFYCFSHWVALPVVYLSGFTTEYGFVLTVLSVIGLSAVFSSLVIGLTSGVIGHSQYESEED